MSDIAMRAVDLGKKYRIGVKQEKYKTLRDTLTAGMLASIRAVRTLVSGSDGVRDDNKNMIWALKEVSFEIHRGEVVGIIGRNGAGKSSLLKILSRITEPTCGRAEIYGRVGSLLEVGTGFHPELTGRENIYLNGAILGMKKAEIVRQLDAIVDFAEIEKFIDTPVKHYSTGMYLRLAFAVAAHLDPEILLVDEVLAVGDAQFQKKCLGKMEDVARGGRTVLFVSHNMAAVLSLCSRSLVLENGGIAYDGGVEEAIESYNKVFLNNNSVADSHILFEIQTASKTAGDAHVARVELLDRTAKPKRFVYTWDDVIIRIHYQAKYDLKSGSLILEIGDRRQQRLIVLESGVKIPLKKGYHYVDCFVPRFPLSAGDYYLGAGITLSNVQWLWREKNIAVLHVLGRDVYEIGRPPLDIRMAFVAEHTWHDPLSPVTGR